MDYTQQEWVGFWIKRINRDMTNMHDRILSEHHLTVAQVGVLAQLWEKDGQTQKEIHERLGIRPASLSNVLDTLVANGFVHRTQDVKDARVKRISLTDQGRAIEKACLDSVHYMEDRLQSDFSREEVRLLVSWLKRLHKNVDETKP